MIQKSTILEMHPILYSQCSAKTWRHCLPRRSKSATYLIEQFGRHQAPFVEDEDEDDESEGAS